MNATTKTRLWCDDRKRAYAVVVKSEQAPVTGADVRPLFTEARARGYLIDRRRPLIVYGTHTTVGESPTFRFEQMADPTALLDGGPAW